MLRSIGRHLVAAGHSVSVYSTQPSYRPGAFEPKQAKSEKLDGISVRRISLLNERRKDLLFRGFNAFLYSVRLFLHILFGRRYDLVVVSTFPPILVAFLACLACKIRRCRFVYHCQDIHPEVSMAIRGKSSGAWLSLLQRIDEWTCGHASTIVVLSEDMRGTLLERSPTAHLNIRIINNFELPQFDSATQVNEIVDFPDAEVGGQIASNAFRVVFAGNFGRFQSLDTVVRAAALLKDMGEIRIVLIGDGVMQAELKELCEGLSCDNVDFMPFQTPTVAKRLISQADFGLVTLRQGMYRVAYPSKTMTYLSAGRPLIVMVEQASELAKSVAAERLGLVVPDGTPEALAGTIREGYQNRQDWEGERSRLKEYAAERSSEKAVLGKWGQLIDSV